MNSCNSGNIINFKTQVGLNIIFVLFLYVFNFFQVFFKIGKWLGWYFNYQLLIIDDFKTGTFAFNRFT